MSRIWTVLSAQSAVVAQGFGRSLPDLRAQRGWMAGLALVALIAVLFPSIDRSVSRYFYDGAHFPVEYMAWAQGLRSVLWNVAIAIALASLVLWGVWLTLGWRARIAPRVFAAIPLLHVVATGLVVDLGLKEHWGRVRPADTTLFGGVEAFTPVWSLDGACLGNCSFVSGEAAGATVTALGLWFLLGPFLGRRRTHVVGALIAYAVLMSGLRVVMGRHFTADVLCSVVITALLAVVLCRVLRLREARETLCMSCLRHDLEVMHSGLRRAWRPAVAGLQHLRASVCSLGHSIHAGAAHVADVMYYAGRVGLRRLAYGYLTPLKTALAT